MSPLAADGFGTSSLAAGGMGARVVAIISYGVVTRLGGAEIPALPPQELDRELLLLNYDMLSYGQSPFLRQQWLRYVKARRKRLNDSPRHITNEIILFRRALLHDLRPTNVEIPGIVVPLIALAARLIAQF